MPRRKKDKRIRFSRFTAPITRSWTPSLDEVCDRIIGCLEESEVPLEFPTIARTLGGSFNIWTVRDGLQRLKDWDIVRKEGSDGWVLSHKVTDEMECVAKEDPKKMILGTITPAETVDCPCPYAGPRCHHIHHNYYQIGTNNTIIHASEPDAEYFRNNVN